MNKFNTKHLQLTNGLIQSKVRFSRAAEVLWDIEYSKKRLLPSTILEEPSRCLQRVTDLFGWPYGFSVLDLGCGNGRHSSYFAKLGCKVYALDISGCAIELAIDRIEQEKLANRVLFYHGSALEHLPIPAGGYDLILDSYMSCHILDPFERVALFANISAALAPSGLFVSFGVSLEDSFYKQYADFISDDHSKVCDPITCIEKLLTSERFLEKELNDSFAIARIGRVSMQDAIATKKYDKQAIYLAAWPTRYYVT